MRNGGRQNERQVMIRIIKLLFSFADMAERAAYRSILVRTFLLAIFRIAEPAARRYVLRYDGNALKIPEPIRGDNISGRTETLHLAWLFRVFATMLANLMAWRDMGRIQTVGTHAQFMCSGSVTNSFTPLILRLPARAPPPFVIQRIASLRKQNARPFGRALVAMYLVISSTISWQPAASAV